MKLLLLQLRRAPGTDTMQAEFRAGAILPPGDLFEAAHQSVETDDEIPHVTREFGLGCPRR